MSTTTSLAPNRGTARRDRRQCGRDKQAQRICRCGRAARRTSSVKAWHHTSSKRLTRSESWYIRSIRPSGGARGAWAVPPTSGTSVGPSTADSRERTPTLTPRCSGMRQRTSACRAARSSRPLSFDTSTRPTDAVQTSPRWLHGEHVGDSGETSDSGIFADRCIVAALMFQHTGIDYVLRVPVFQYFE